MHGPSALRTRFRGRRERTWIPGIVRGLFHKYGLPAYIELGLADGDWLTPATGSGSGRSFSGVGRIYMHCYTHPESKFYQSSEMLDRTIALLDAYRRYQGDKGALEIGGGSNGWIGGPERTSVSGGLQGFFMANLAHSFLSVWPQVKDTPAILNAPVDSDGDGSTDVTRIEAWAELFRSYLTYQSERPGGVANQARANATGAGLALRALQTMHPDESPGAEHLNLLVERGCGLAPHPKNGGIWMLTKGGLSLEAQGFCPGYGQHTNVQYPELYEASGDARVLEQYLKSLDLFAFMVFAREGTAGGPLLVSGPQGSRHHPFPGKHLEWLPLVKVAVDYQAPFAIWSVDRMLRVSNNLEDPPLKAERGVHLPGDAAQAIEVLQRLPGLKNLISKNAASDYRLPALDTKTRIKTGRTDRLCRHS